MYIRQQSRRGRPGVALPSDQAPSVCLLCLSGEPVLATVAVRGGGGGVWPAVPDGDVDAPEPAGAAAAGGAVCALPGAVQPGGGGGRLRDRGRHSQQVRRTPEQDMGGVCRAASPQDS